MSDETAKNESLVVQIQKRGPMSRKLIAQNEVFSQQELDDWINRVKSDHNIAPGELLICTSDSPDFMMMKTPSRP